MVGDSLLIRNVSCSKVFIEEVGSVDSCVEFRQAFAAWGEIVRSFDSHADELACRFRVDTLRGEGLRVLHGQRLFASLQLDHVVD